jgi:Mce-associated membrane protein
VSAEDVGADEVSAAKPDAEKPADTAEAATADDAAAGKAEAPRRPGLFAGGGGVPVLVTLIVLVVGALVAVGFLAAQSRAAASERENRAEALRIARQLTVDFTSLDYRSYDADVKRVQQLASGELGKQTSNMLADAEAKKLITTGKAVSKGKVLDAGLVSFDQDSARALVVADATITNVLTKQPEVRHFRLQLDLYKEPEGWRVIDLGPVG